MSECVAGAGIYVCNQEHRQEGTDQVSVCVNRCVCVGQRGKKSKYMDHDNGVEVSFHGRIIFGLCLVSHKSIICRLS